MPSKRFDDMSRHDPPGRIHWRINLETGKAELHPAYDPEAEAEFARKRMHGYGRTLPEDPLEGPLQPRPEPE